jgi:diguanylate cyclase (GGDEF)-like protein
VLGGDLLVAARGWYRHDATTDRFARDARFPDSFSGAHGLTLCPLPDGSVVASADHRLLYLERTDAGFASPGSVVERIPLGNRLIACLVEDGVVWLGTDDGLYRWDRDAPVPPRTNARVHVRRVTRGEEGLIAASLQPGLGTRLPPLTWERAPLRFDFALTSYVAAERNEYRTLLEGFEGDWTAWGRVASREFTNLPPGRYRLRIEGRDVRRATAPETSLDFVIRPPWYRSSVAYGGYGVAALVTLIGAGQIQARKVRRRNRELQQLVAERTEELRAASITDPLTGLHNRRFFAEVIGSEVAAVRRSRHRDPEDQARELVLCLIDLDHFKAINDRFGHAGGDEALRQVAGRLRATCRENDLLFRWGGEELLLLARDTRGKAGAAELARRLLSAIGDEPLALGSDAGGHAEGARPYRLTCSIGFAALPFFGDAPAETTLDDVLRFADAALYEAKRAGRNRACGARPSLPFAVVGARWPDWRNHSLTDAAASWLELVTVAGLRAAGRDGPSG